jgi:hypothetical protein
MMCALDPRKGVYTNALPTRRSAAGPAAADLVYWRRGGTG